MICSSDFYCSKRGIVTADDFSRIARAYAQTSVARTSIQFGHDTDTTAAVACGLAGIKFGVEGISARWLAQLRGYEIVEPLIARLMAIS